MAAEADRRRKAEEARKAKAAKDAERAELRRQVCVRAWAVVVAMVRCPHGLFHHGHQQAQEEAERMARETPDERALRERLAVRCVA